MPTNRWIVVRGYYEEYRSPERAQLVRDRLQAAEPSQLFVTYRIKRTSHEPRCPLYKYRMGRISMVCSCSQGVYPDRAEIVQPMGDYDDMIAGVAAEMAAS
jgi:hypothetical protein